MKTKECKKCKTMFHRPDYYEDWPKKCTECGSKNVVNIKY